MGSKRYRKCSWCARKLYVPSAFDGESRTCRRCIIAKRLATEHGIEFGRGEGAKLCARCGEVKRWSVHVGRSEYNRNSRESTGFYSYCAECARGYRRNLYAEQPYLREVQARRDKERYDRVKADPERWQRRLDQLREGRLRYYRRIRKDPERWARELENKRINAALRAERQSREKGRQRTKNGYLPVTGGFGERRLSADPLREWLTVVFEREKDPLVLSHLLEIPPRRLWALRHGEYQTVTLGVADRALTRYGQPVRVNGYGPVEFLWDLWPELAEDEG